MTIEIKKTSVKVWRPIIEKLDDQMESACLRRDAYINRLLEQELPRLNQEVSIPNSPEAQMQIATRLDHLDRKPLSLAIRRDLLDELNAMCASKRIVRDAFFNRLFLALVVGPKFISRLFFDGSDEWQMRVWEECRSDGVFFERGFSQLDQAIDPFWAIREGISLYGPSGEAVIQVDSATGFEVTVVKNPMDGEIQPLDSFYTTAWDQNTLPKVDLFGMNTYVPNSQVPGHPAAEARIALLDELLADL